MMYWNLCQKKAYGIRKHFAADVWCFFHAQKEVVDIEGQEETEVVLQQEAAGG